MKVEYFDLLGLRFSKLTNEKHVSNAYKRRAVVETAIPVAFQSIYTNANKSQQLFFTRFHQKLVRNANHYWKYTIQSNIKYIW